MIKKRIRKIQITMRTKFDVNIKCQGIRLKKKINKGFKTKYIAIKIMRI